MDERRLVGIDLGITSAHPVRVLAGDGSLVCRARAIPTVESLEQVERVALAQTPVGTLLEVVLEPTGPAWLPIAVFFAARGHTVYRVSSAKAHDLRRVLSRHAKANGIDADTLARLPLVDPAGLHPLELPSAERAALDRRVRACDRLTRQAASHKRRVKDLVHQLLPASPSAGPATGRSEPPWSVPPTTPAAKTPSWPASTGPRWCNAARTTWGRCVWSPLTWPSGPGWSWTAARPMWSATPTVSPSPPNRPRPSSPSAGPCPNRSAGGGATRRGRPLNKSSPDMSMALEAQRGDPPLAGQSWPTHRPRQADPAPTLTAKPP
jgi:Transposase